MKRTAIFGPPGTGKTTKLMEIIEQEIDAGTNPADIAFVSFTNAAVDEAKKRVVEKFKMKKRDMFWFRTIHSLCFSLSRTPGQRVITSYDLKVFAKLYKIADFSGNPRRKERGDIALEAYNLARQSQIDLKDAWMRCTNWVTHEFSIMEEFVQAYEQWKKANGRVDFQDMIDNYLQDPVSPDIKVSIIDEVQDLNGQQWQVIDHTFIKSERQYIAGDDDQAIYAWSGSRIDRMIEYPADETIVLKKSHRCPKEVHAVANLILSRIKRRKKKDWEPRDGSGAYFSYGDYSYVPFTKHRDESWFILARSDFMLDDVRWWLKSIGEIYRDEKGLSVNHHIAQKIMTIIKLQNGESVSAESVRRAIWESTLDYSAIDLVHLPTKGMVDAKFCKLDLNGVDPIGIYAKAIKSDADIDYYYRALAVNGDLCLKPNIELSTIHKVKGRQADNVVVLLDQTGTIIDSAHLDPDNEHRNWYVAVTRAKKRLFTVLGKSVHNYQL